MATAALALASPGCFLQVHLITLKYFRETHGRTYHSHPDFSQSNKNMHSLNGVLGWFIQMDIHRT